MVGGASASGATRNVTGMRIVVTGDAKTGKLSLIVMAATENYSNNVSPLLPPTRLPEDVYPDRVPLPVKEMCRIIMIYNWFCCKDGSAGALWKVGEADVLVAV
ncbi:Mitochondrial Rho GTPase [Forsythia ovata]|uniref:Mitochondrial Rho GTPase n=1 Tax=Forsythia ovata TaxID=205694 RepID=A0ABD1X6R1_9LAMI